MKQILTLSLILCLSVASIAGQRQQQYFPKGNAFVCENGVNRFTRALYGSPTDWRLETSDRPVFAVVKKGHHRNISMTFRGVALDSTDYCQAIYDGFSRTYLLKDSRWGDDELHISVMTMPEGERAIWKVSAQKGGVLSATLRHIALPKLYRNGDIGADKPGCLEAAGDALQQVGLTVDGEERFLAIDTDSLSLPDITETKMQYRQTHDYWEMLSGRVCFETPDPYINTLASALVMAADGDWDGQTWLHGCVGWRMPLAGWRAAYVGDVLGWNERAVTHFDAYAKSQVTDVSATIAHPAQDSAQNMARAEKRWGTQMYSTGYICRNPERNDQMHHYDMNLNYIDELLWHFQYDADTVYMRKMWPVLTRHLAWEKRNFDPDGDHLYDAYCCIWASDALYYSGGAVTHSSAYNYRANLLTARIADIIGEPSQPYRDEADAILKALNQRLWMPEKGVWAEFQDAMGLKRLHDHPAVWSIYTPIDCGACSSKQAYEATQYVDKHIPHIPVEGGYSTIATSDWLPYSWSINNVAAAEVMHTALAYFLAGRAEEGYRLMKGNVMDQMYYGQSPANFGQVSHFDAARGECYRDFGDCIGISSRTLIQGLFGIQPEALYGRCVIHPGFPAEWNQVSVETPYIKYRYWREKGRDMYEITQSFSRPLKIVLRQNLGDGKMRDIEGTAEAHQIISVDHQYRPVKMSGQFNASVTDIFRNRYVSPRPMVTTLQIPTQGIGDWCHPQMTAEINDSVFRSLIDQDGVFTVAGVPFLTPQQGNNILFTTLWDNYPDAVTLPLSGQAERAYLLLAGSTNHMQSRMDNGQVMVTYTDNTSATLTLRNPDNWCPIEQDYFVDGQAFATVHPRPLRVSFATGTVSRNLGEALHIEGVDGRRIPGGAAQMLEMPLNKEKKLKLLTLRTLSNDVVIGLMGITLQ